MTRGAAGRRQHALFEIHAAEPIPARLETRGAGRECLQIPDVGEHAAARVRLHCLEGVLEPALEIGNRRRHEESGRCERFDSAVAEARGDQGDSRCAACERAGHRSREPLGLLRRGDERHAHQEEHAQRRAELQDAIGRPAELVERESLVELPQGIGVRRFQSHRHLESRTRRRHAPRAASAARKRVSRGPISAGCDSTITWVAPASNAASGS